MYSEEETELRDLIVQNLENCGFLNKIKAELRAGVFLALEEDDNLKSKIPLLNQKFEEFSKTQDGKFVISLVREFLEFFSLNFTLSVFGPETSSSASHIPRSELCEQLNLKSSEIDGPILSSLLKDTLANRTFNKSFEEQNSSEKVVKPLFSDTATSDIKRESLSKPDNIENSEKPTFSLETDSASNPSIKKDIFNETVVVVDEKTENKKAEINTLTDIFKAKNEENDKGNTDSIFKKSDDLQPSHDPFFDVPLPSGDKPFFSFSDSLKGKTENKLSSSTFKEPEKTPSLFSEAGQEKPENKSTSSGHKDADDVKKSSLSSLKDLPSLSAGHEWAFSRDSKSLLPSLDSNKSVSSSEASNEEIINLDPKESPKNKDSESNEESSEKQQNSEESIIEEEIEEDDFSTGFDDLLNSSLSLGDDVTTDQTVSQVSAVDGVDHVEPCK